MPVEDDSLPHQIRLRFGYPPGSRTLEPFVSCTCRLERRVGASKPGYTPMGWHNTHAERMAAYNDPSNHNQGVHPFESATEAGTDRQAP